MLSKPAVLGHCAATALFGAAALSFSLLGAGPVLSVDNPAACERFAKTAVQHDAEARANDCGYDGELWSDRPAYHIGLCQTQHITAADLKKMNEKRREMLASCKSGGKSGGGGLSGDKLSKRCKKYADVAVKQNQRARKAKCGLDGDRWSSDPAFHVNWCKKVGGKNKTLREQRQERRAKIQACLNKSERK